MTWRRALVAVALVAGPCVVAAPGAHAADQDPQAGWWSTTDTSAVPAPPVAVPVPVDPATATAPDVPEDGLLVQGSADAPTAYAAVAYPVPPGVRAGTLTLTQAPGTASTPGAALKLCPLVEASFTPAQGGPAADAPEYDCGKSVDATVTGADYAFEAGPLVHDGVLAVAVVPASPVARVVLGAPTAASLGTSGTPSGPSGGTASAPEPAGGAQPDSTPPGPAGGTGTASDPGLSTAVDPAGSVVPDSVPPADAAPLEAPAPVQEPAVVAPDAASNPYSADSQAAVPVAQSASTSGGGSPGRVLGVLLAGALALAASLWAFAGSAAATREGGATPAR